MDPQNCVLKKVTTKDRAKSYLLWHSPPFDSELGFVLFHKAETFPRGARLSKGRPAPITNSRTLSMALSKGHCPGWTDGCLYKRP